jgi:hypothetical protein
MKKYPVRRKSGPTTATATPEPGPTLPAWKACVVQFTRETGTATGIFAGRVEHLSSGRRARFGSSAELLSILERLLDELGSEEGQRDLISDEVEE